MGSSVGTSAVTTILARRAQVHQVMLASHTAVSSTTFGQTADALASRLEHGGVHGAQLQAYGRMYRTMQDQASALSYIDTFWLLGIAAGIMFCLSFLLKKNNPRGAGGTKALAH
jgi:DHA2 family multidrug resistance protein